MKYVVQLLWIVLCFANICFAQTSSSANSSEIIPGAAQTHLYVPLLKGKTVGVFANQTSCIGQTHLVDSLQKMGIRIKYIFSPEHGFRGKADAGERVESSVDSATGLTVISLYGKKDRPSADDLKDIDILLFDIQDVGVRFYTYINSLQHFMEAAIENHLPLVILDRPNPNGFYVDGPVLQKGFESGVGQQPVPIVYGMTIGEYATMLLGEKWLRQQANITYSGKLKTHPDGKMNFEVMVVPNKNYTHQSKYILPVAPSPNLREMQSVYLYPSTCLFEGTVLSEGRGTSWPFQIFGHPTLPPNLFNFTPKPNEGAKNSKCFYQLCYGWNLHAPVDETLKEIDGHIQLKWLMRAYSLFPGKDSFFLKNNFFNRLAGNDVLMQQIKDGVTEAKIRQSWEPDLSKFKLIRKKYLLYP